ncbi:uncharacterized protein SPPG_06484 [Spizellomyces punctatus DAOM BR117]|uniref:PX domain-containing protein n=1 Tax=Spizellomyces punctatus (strain DAOM BR117) TaxID=645134 RepID=A0A0L0HA98_SPIPD|nr:uncharacterized protein SPPG_06484 [Spizellomyces punctatus DAOM BR117]KNC98072.1 hypothetical protein SPPG_06484 [Spizellomyces punctatus DAOM BR117]|eukprot:XP_016606112.1 hypothetical protein SPPG_06484 [Spizellomyces punctatus DAOM BR117]
MFSFLSSTWSWVAVGPQEEESSCSSNSISSDSLSDDSSTASTTTDSDGDEAYSSSLESLSSLDNQDLVDHIVDQGQEYQIPQPPARSHLQAMNTLFLSDALNSKVNALRHDVLRARLCELVLTVEFASSYGANARTLTVAPIPAVLHLNLVTPSVPSDFPGPGVLPPLTRALYVRLFRDLPLFAGHGAKYLAGLDDFMEHEFLDFVGKWMRATKFDVLSFSLYYVTLFSHLKNEAWYGVDDNAAPLPTFSTRPILRPATLYPDLLCYYRASLPGGGSFRLSKRERKTPDTDETLELRELKARGFTDAWRSVLKAGCGICRELIGDDSEAEVDLAERFWDVVKSSPEIMDLPPTFQDFFYSIITAVAHAIDNILDDAEWRHKFASIWKRLPVSIMLTSLRLVNPVPFVDRVIKLFCWKPPGMYSLLQKIGAMICALDRTQAALRIIAKNVQQSRRCAIERTIDAAFEQWRQSCVYDISSQDPAEKIRDFLRNSDEKTFQTTISKSEVAFAKCYIRKKEKEDFVEVLGSKDVVDFVKHFCEMVPPLLDEVWKCIDIATLMSKLVDTVSQILEGMTAYDSPTESLAKTHSQVIGALYSALLPFFKAAYPLLPAVAKRPPAGPAGIHALVEHLLYDVMRPRNTRGSILELGKDARVVVDSLTPTEKARLWKEVDGIIANMEAGIDAREWEPCEVLEGKGLQVFWDEIVREFTGSVKEEAVVEQGVLGVD